MTAASSDSIAVKSEVHLATAGVGMGSNSNAAVTSNASVNEDYIQKMKLKVQNTRIALSKQGARFELPIDMKSLEKQSPAGYLIERCHVTKRRENLYKKHFQNHDKDKDQKLNIKDLEKAMKDVFVDTIDSETVETVRVLAGIRRDELVSLQLFSPLCALSERIMHQKYSTGETSLDPSYSQKDKLEEADFSSLAWKLSGIKISKELTTLLYVILDPIEYLPKNLLEAESSAKQSLAGLEPKSESQPSDSTTEKHPKTAASDIAGAPPTSTETSK